MTILHQAVTTLERPIAIGYPFYVIACVVIFAMFGDILNRSGSSPAWICLAVIFTPLVMAALLAFRKRAQFISQTGQLRIDRAGLWLPGRKKEVDGSRANIVLPSSW